MCVQESYFHAIVCMFTFFVLNITHVRKQIKSFPGFYLMAMIIITSYCRIHSGNPSRISSKEYVNLNQKWQMEPDFIGYPWSNSYLIDSLKYQSPYEEFMLPNIINSIHTWLKKILEVAFPTKISNIIN